MLVNVHDAKTNLSQLLRRVEDGEEITIARHGKPVARLVAVVPEKPKVRFGFMKDKIWMADDWDSPETNAEIERWFYEGIEKDDDL